MNAPFPKLKMIEFTDPETAKEAERRWNAHDELVAALENALAFVKFVLRDPYEFSRKATDQTRLIDEIQDALKNVKDNHSTS